jgi:hypothetical protein
MGIASEMEIEGGLMRSMVSEKEHPGAAEFGIDTERAREVLQRNP